ncbi:hypothetical protein IU501_33595 [Nocardia otitidiscaviarum]|uniref:hypothetical protein n=1 Tax=Nocardia otitidiscaviarum TaxID=1823 RepID=UPI0011DDCD0A|nr:hypothetical protein [Nocardia otitidiscaviarum]MBF6137905.1 hypothetical protein [Nocardia otitidiscaviarum]MBF6488801.1 hypothetical protein [Nocardia otitidiscaviarum]
MFASRRLPAAVLCGAVVPLLVLLPAAAAPGTVLGGCYDGDVLTAERVPGTGSVGQSVRRAGEVWDCRSSLLPGITAGRFRAELPWRGFGAPTSGSFTWSDGSISTVTGLPNSLWTITSGPGSGHAVRFDLAMEMTGDWYYTEHPMGIESLSFVS